MKLLFLCSAKDAASTPCRAVGRAPELSVGPHEWVRATEGAADEPGVIGFRLQHDTIDDLLARVPGAAPEAIVVWQPGYQALPTGLDATPIPVVACYSDWNLVMPDQAGMLDAFDYLFTDRAGVRVLQAMGHGNAEFWPMWGHDPEFTTVLPGVPKHWDIGMIGNLNPVVQRERAPWLARVARLADRFRVRIAGGVHGEEYVRTLNAT